MVKPIRKATRRKPLALTATEARVGDAITALKALQVSGVGRPFEPADLQPIIDLLAKVE